MSARPLAPAIVPGLTAAVLMLPRPMDLVSSGSLEANGLPLNPRWGLQQSEPGALPDPVELCFDVPGWFDNEECTVQRPSVDRPAGVKNAICSIGATTPIAGHVNWFAATYTGPVFWDGKFWSDQDINVRLVPPDRNGLTTAAPEAILGEFDARETLNHFATPWWKKLRRAANLARQERGRALVDGRPAVVTGLVGLDCEHGCGTELHPVWAMGVHAAAEAERETWAIFARNSGNEGFCSSQQHELELPGDRLTVTLPWRVGATRVRLGWGTAFFANVEGLSAWWSARPGRQVDITFQLPPPAERGRVHGEIVLVWSGSPSAPTPPGLAPPEREREGGAEALLQDVVEGLSPAQRRALDAGDEAAVEDRVPVPLERGDPPALPAAASARPPSVSSAADPARDLDDLRRLRRLLQAHRGRLPGPLQDLPALLREP
jgi:hypothetical protein